MPDLDSFLCMPCSLCPCPQVPQRIEEPNVATDEENAGMPGVWGSWGPWSACSRSCDGGVMEQTRPCLPGYYYDERSYRRTGQFWGSERTLANQPRPHQEDPANAYSGHVISAIRTSVPLHRNEEDPRAGLRAGFSLGGRNDSRLSKGTPRGGRLPQARRRSPKSERRYSNTITHSCCLSLGCCHSCSDANDLLSCDGRDVLRDVIF